MDGGTHPSDEVTVEGGAVAMDRLRLVEEAGAAQDVTERNMTAEWAALTTGSAIKHNLAPKMSHHGSHSNDNGVFCNEHYRQRTK